MARSLKAGIYGRDDLDRLAAAALEGADDCAIVGCVGTLKVNRWWVRVYDGVAVLIVSTICSACRILGTAEGDVL